MTSDLKDLTHTTFYLMYHLGLQPTEVDNLSTYEMREYISLLKENRKIESENESNTVKFFSKLLSFTGRKR